jgi:hypothetical protein
VTAGAKANVTQRENEIERDSVRVSRARYNLVWGRGGLWQTAVHGSSRLGE